MAADWLVVFNNFAAGSYHDGTVLPVDFVGIDGLGDIPEVISADRPRLRRHGIIAGDDFLGARTITVRYIFDQASWVDDLARMRRAFQPCTEELPLQFRVPGVAGMPEDTWDARTVMARVRRRSIPTTLEFRMGLAFADVQFICTDPRIYGGTVTNEVFLPVSINGLAFNAAFPMSFGGNNVSGSMSFNNEGDFATEWTATIRNACTNPRIINNTTGAYLQFNTTLVDGETLSIDSQNRTATLNGVASRYYTISVGSTWFDLPPGNTDLVFRADAYSPSAVLRVDAAPAWM